MDRHYRRADGNYTLEMEANPERILPESNYDNNVVRIRSPSAMPARQRQLRCGSGSVRQFSQRERLNGQGHQGGGRTEPRWQRGWGFGVVLLDRAKQ